MLLCLFRASKKGKKWKLKPGLTSSKEKGGDFICMMITTFARKRLQDCCMFLKLATNDKRDRLQESYSLILMSETSAKAMKLNEGKK